ncbi:hypothetical protein [Salicibibacter kimchii]|uniref:Uncharacterized protein n=1 Tax=Salicibibacter kimchii TaxID=2099786 RepID=A0A345BYP1_9BACI|nr:hypothetical protein [Salicibibacter kimchii]AXF56072.1 hypothetical protein DT065_08565 [Salicibibacter kimchii]
MNRFLNVITVICIVYFTIVLTIGFSLPDDYQPPPLLSYPMLIIAALLGFGAVLNSLRSTTEHKTVTPTLAIQTLIYMIILISVMAIV